MGKITEDAVNNHKNWYSCSASVLCAFAGEAGLTEREAQKLADPMGSGRMGKCGALLAAKWVLEEKYSESESKNLIEKLEKDFAAQCGSVKCSNLMGKCRQCVTVAAEILEGIITERS